VCVAFDRNRNTGDRLLKTDLFGLRESAALPASFSEVLSQIEGGELKGFHAGVGRVRLTQAV
jgi:hypothetical protein